MIQLLEYVYRFLTSKWSPVSVYLGAMYVMYNNFLGILDKIHSVIDNFDNLAFPSLGGTSASVAPLALINYVLPLDLAIAMFTVWLPFFLVANAARVIKAYVPTIA